MNPTNQDSGSMPLDGQPDLSEAERLALRRIIRDEERASWARSKLRVFVPGAVAIVVAVWQAVEWIRNHVTIR